MIFLEKSRYQREVFARNIPRPVLLRSPKKFNIFDGFVASLTRRRPPQISSINHLTVFQCSKPCGSGTMMRKVFCVKNETKNMTLKCNSNAIMFFSEDCNVQPCESGIFYDNFINILRKFT